MPLDLARALADGDTFIKNAEEAMERKVLREDQLYIWDNQVEVLDTYLADTEDIEKSSPELATMRTKLREYKKKLERLSMEFLAQQDKEPLPEDASPEEEAAMIVESGKDLLKEADKVLKKNLTKIEDVGDWEEPLVWLNSWIADSETFVTFHKDLPKLRGDMKDRKRDLEKRIADLVGQWRASDASGGDEEEE